MEFVKSNKFATVQVMDLALDMNTATRESAIDDIKYSGQAVCYVSPAGTVDKPNNNKTVRFSQETLAELGAVSKGKIIAVRVANKQQVFVAAIPQLEGDDAILEEYTANIDNSNVAVGKVWDALSKRGFGQIIGAASKVSVSVPTMNGLKVSVVGFLYDGTKNIFESVEGGSKPAALKAVEEQALKTMADKRKTATV